MDVQRQQRCRPVAQMQAAVPARSAASGPRAATGLAHRCRPRLLELGRGPDRQEMGPRFLCKRAAEPGARRAEEEVGLVAAPVSRGSAALYASARDLAPVSPRNRPNQRWPRVWKGVSPCGLSDQCFSLESAGARVRACRLPGEQGFWQQFDSARRCIGSASSNSQRTLEASSLRLTHSKVAPGCGVLRPRDRELGGQPMCRVRTELETNKQRRRERSGNTPAECARR